MHNFSVCEIVIYLTEQVANGVIESTYNYF